MTRQCYDEHEERHASLEWKFGYEETKSQTGRFVSFYLAPIACGKREASALSSLNNFRQTSCCPSPSAGCNIYSRLRAFTCLSYHRLSRLLLSTLLRIAPRRPDLRPYVVPVDVDASGFVDSILVGTPNQNAWESPRRTAFHRVPTSGCGHPTSKSPHITKCGGGIRTRNARARALKAAFRLTVQ